MDASFRDIIVVGDDRKFCFRGHTIPITASFGVAERQDSMQIPEDMLYAADQAMYVAKRTGKQRIVAARSIPTSPPNGVALLPTEPTAAEAIAARWPIGTPNCV